MESDFAALEAGLEQVLGRDRPQLRRRLAALRRRFKQGQAIDRGLPRVRQAIADSAQTRARRAAFQPNLDYDAALPISQHVAAIGEALQEHQVIIVAGETGSGKTTQLPKICLQAGRGLDGWIGCTQPRRIAARSIAARLGEELGVALGTAVGYQVRFDQRVTADSFIKVMTDGILLAEIEHDRLLHAYDTLIVDEAHERSLNIDFLLGYLKRILPRRPDLRVIITSATIDTERFSAHFDQAPVVRVSGRTYPVELRYRPQKEDEPGRDLALAITEAVEELSHQDARGDVLVFLPGERDISEAHDYLARQNLRHTEVLPLYARLSADQQSRIFHPGPKRRIILSTNVAETSLTVPRIHFVIDSGLARISRYSYRSKVQRLPIEAISQASANQRSGRCGRLGPGICLRLYGAEDFEQRAEFTDPEIVRTNLAAVILQMAVLGLGEIETFPFLDPPDTRFIKDGYQLLFELGALDQERRLTPLGRQLAQWPLDVRLARLIHAGHEQHCLAEALTLATVLSIQDPRERPVDAAQAADQAQAQWADPRSDFSALLKLWQDWQAQAKTSRKQQRQWCRQHFLSYPRMREWRDLRRQLNEQSKQAGWRVNREAASYEALHRAVVTAWLGQIGMHDERDYLGPRGQRFHLFPGSGLHGRGPKWVVSAMLVETARVYARINAKIDPDWVEQVGAHLLKHHAYDPYWSKRMGRVMGYEQITLYGLPLVQRRRIHFGPRDVKTARMIFIRDALATGELITRGGFAAHNRALIEGVEHLEDKQRRRNLLADEQALYQFFDQRLPQDIHNTRHFERWRTATERQQPKILYLSQDDLLLQQNHQVTEARFPDHLEHSGVRFELTYTLAPGEAEDGVNVKVPIHLLNTLDPKQLQWLVPGLLHDKVVALIKALPKPVRRHFVPAPDWAADFVQHADGQSSLHRSLALFLTQRGQVEVAADAFDHARTPDHLHFNFVLYQGAERLAQGRDLVELKKQWGDAARDEFLVQAGDGLVRDGLSRWDFGVLPVSVQLDGGSTAYPALVDQADAVGIRSFETAQVAADHHRHGLRRLLELTLRDKFRYLQRAIEVDQATCLQYASVDTCQQLRRDVLFAVSMACVDECSDSVRDGEKFQELCARTRRELVAKANQLMPLVRESIQRFHSISRRLDEDFHALFPAAAVDIDGQLGYLIYAGFLTEVSVQRLSHYPRYLNAIEVRIERLQRDPATDNERQQRLASFWQDYLDRVAALEAYPYALDQFHWLLEEYRVSLFAQQLKTAEPVSSKRLRKAWARVPKPQ